MAEQDPGISYRSEPAFITSERIDRMGDILRARGMQVENFLANPVVALQHGRVNGGASSHPVVGRGGPFTLDTTPTGNLGWKSPIAFGDHALGLEIGGLWRSGLFNATSVGFQPITWRPIDTDGKPLLEERAKPFADAVRGLTGDLVIRKLVSGEPIASEAERELRAACAKGIAEFGGFEFLEWELTEFSVVMVPANPDAVKALEAAAERLARHKGNRSKAGAAMLLEIAKAGQVLSAVNKGRIESARDSLEEVLASAAPPDEDDAGKAAECDYAAAIMPLLPLLEASAMLAVED